MTNALLLRRRGMMKASNKQIITLNQADFMYRRGNNPDYPYYKTNNTRISHPDFDLRIDETGAWRFDLDTNYSTAQLGFRFYTQDTLAIVSEQGNIQNTYYDPGWQPINTVINVPSAFNNSPIVGFTLTIRQSTSNPNISSNFIINSFIARKL